MAHSELLPASRVRLLGFGIASVVLLYAAVIILSHPHTYSHLMSPSFSTLGGLSLSRSKSKSIHPLNPSSSPSDRYVPNWPASRIPSSSLIGKVTMLFHNKDSTFVRALRSHETHNNRFGYPLIVLRHGLLDGTLEGVWNKPAYVLAVLLEEMRKEEGERLKWLFWVDADTVIMNPLVPLEIFLPPTTFANMHLLVTADPHGLNNGIFFIRVHPWSVILLSAILSFHTTHPSTTLEYRDQSALIELLQEKPFKKNYAILPQRWFNAYQEPEDNEEIWRFKGEVRKGDLLVHFPGVPRREERMRFYLEKAERHLPEWELDVERTGYMSEIGAFWEGEREKMETGRQEVWRAVEEAKNLIRVVKERIGSYGGNLKGEDQAMVEKVVEMAKGVLDDEGKREDADAVREVIELLRDETAPLNGLFEEAKHALLTEAHAAIADAEHYLANAELSDDTRVVQSVRASLEMLREKIAREPDGLENIRNALTVLIHDNRKLEDEGYEEDETNQSQ